MTTKLEKGKLDPICRMKEHANKVGKRKVGSNLDPTEFENRRGSSCYNSTIRYRQPYTNVILPQLKKKSDFASARESLKF